MYTYSAALHYNHSGRCPILRPLGAMQAEVFCTHVLQFLDLSNVKYFFLYPMKALKSTVTGIFLATWGLLHAEG